MSPESASWPPWQLQQATSTANPHPLPALVSPTSNPIPLPPTLRNEHFLQPSTPPRSATVHPKTNPSSSSLATGILALVLRARAHRDAGWALDQRSRDGLEIIGSGCQGMAINGRRGGGSMTGEMTMSYGAWM